MIPPPSEKPETEPTRAEKEPTTAGHAPGSESETLRGVDETVALTRAEALASEPEGGPDDLARDLEAAFGDRYELGAILGQGGFGSVFRGFDRRLNRAVAIKSERIDRRAGAGTDAMLEEARRLAQLRHPGIVTVHDVGVVPRRCFIISELLSGPSLAAWLRKAAPSWAEAAEIVALAAEALAHAHSRSIVHRDVKPANIILIDNRRPVLVDFGLALSDEEASDSRGMVSGTPAYMSPEQARGGSNGTDGRTDVYSLGVTFYEMLCGRTPFRGQDFQILRKIADDDPQPPRQLRLDLPVELEQVCLKAMAKAPGDRYATASDFAADLRRACGPLAGALPTFATLVEPPPAPVLLSPTPTPWGSRGSGSSSRSGPERRQVTVLRGTFEPAEGADLDLDEVHEQFQALEAACRAIVDQFEGAILPAAGTTFLACFGYPTAREDSPRRAVQAALAVASAVASPARSIAAGWSARVAVHTGLAVVGEAPGQPLAVVGDVMTGVTRLEPAFDPPGVLISEATNHLVAGFFECEAAGAVRMRGSGPPSAVFRVTAEGSARNRIEASDPGRLTPLVGRDREVELLRERWELAAEGLGHVMLLVGDPGLGKSRLVHVMKEHVANAGGAIVEWSCSPYHQNSPLHPVIDVVARNLPAAGGAGPERDLDRLLDMLTADGVTDPEHHALVAAMLSIPTDGRLPALEMSTEREKERLHEVLLDWLRLRSTRRPILFVVEDLHWVDPTTQDLLGRFVENGGDESILAMFTFRPEYEPPWKGRARQTQMALTRLSRRQVTDMIRAQTGSASVPQAVIDQIVDRTDGVPLFIEEFAKALAEGGEAGAGVASIPATLQDLLVARLDRLASDKDVAQLGAVIGRSFDHEMILAASGLDESTLRIELDKLVGAGLLFVKGAPPRCSYTFKHALIQDAAYQSLVKKRRQQFHQTIAERLEAQFPDVAETQPEVLARHFTEAGLTARGIEYWLKAGVRARERSAHLEAVRHLTRGLELVAAAPPSPGRDALELSFRLPLSASFLALRGYAAREVEEQILQARVLCERLGPASPLFPVMMITWALRFIQGRNALARTLSGEILALAEARDDDSCRAEARWTACCTAWWAGRFADALDHGERGLAVYRVEPSVEHSRYTQQNSGPLLTAYTGLALWSLGRLDQARRRMDEAVALAESLRHPYTLVVTLWKPGFMSLLAGDAPGTIHWADKVVAVSEEQSFEFWIALGNSLKGGALSLLGRHAEAITLLLESIKRIEGTGCEMVHQHALGRLSEALWHVGKRDEAWEALNQAFSLTHRDDERYAEAELHRRRALFLADESPGDLGPAAESLEAALSVARKQGAKFFELRAALALGEIWRAGGRADEALAMVRGLADGFTEGFDAPDLVAAREFLWVVC